MSGHVLPLAGSSAPWHGGRISAFAICVLAPNPSPWTLDGTNTWLLTAPGTTDALVIDPGPQDEGHLAAVRNEADHRDLRIRGVLLTHGHSDHAAGARAFADSVGVGVRALDPMHRLGSEGLAHGDVVPLGDGEIVVVGTPGHTADSVSFLLRHDGSLLTGDTVLGRGTSLVAWPDGRLGEYLDSLARLRDVAEGARVERLLPGHGPALGQPTRVIDDYVTHRRARLAEVAAVVADGLTEPRAIVEVVYADVSPLVWPAAELTVRAQLEYLNTESTE